MIHTIISWDFSYRNFFHLIDGLLAQNFLKEEFELIFIELRTKKHANKYNHSLGLKSLEDRYYEVNNNMNITIRYLNKPKKIPDNWGFCNNEGLRLAKGDIISVMDGDLLLPFDFLTKLYNFHKKNKKAVVNVFRKNCAYPVGVKSFNNWITCDVDFKKCLRACPSQFDPIPRYVENKGPMISARKVFWEAIEGYDENPIWGTIIAKNAEDVNTRLEIVTGESSICFPDSFVVHLWHPRVIYPVDRKKFYSFQDQLVNWSIENKKYKVSDRTPLANQIYEQNAEQIKKRYDIKGSPTKNLNIYNYKNNIIKRTLRKIDKVIIFKKRNLKYIKGILIDIPYSYRLSIMVRLLVQGKITKTYFIQDKFIKFCDKILNLIKCLYFKYDNYIELNPILLKNIKKFI